MRSPTVAACVAAALSATGVGAQSPARLDGAWRVVEVEYTGPGRTVGAPQPGLLLFVGGYYSYTFVTSDVARPQIPAGPATPEDLVAAWNPFTANAGTYEVSGTTMTRRPFVAKSPAAMAPGAFNEYSFRLTADTLWVTTTATETGPVRSPSTVRYLRLR